MLRDFGLKTQMFARAMAVTGLTAVIGAIGFFGANEIRQIATTALEVKGLDGVLQQRQAEHLRWALQAGAFRSDPSVDVVEVEKDASRCSRGCGYRAPSAKWPKLRTGASRRRSRQSRRPTASCTPRQTASRSCCWTASGCTPSASMRTSSSPRGIGTHLAHNDAYKSIGQGKQFFGPMDILGHGYDTCYSLVRNAEGQTIGVYYVGYHKK